MASALNIGLVSCTLVLCEHVTYELTLSRYTSLPKVTDCCGTGVKLLLQNFVPSGQDIMACCSPFLHNSEIKHQWTNFENIRVCRSRFIRYRLFNRGQFLRILGCCSMFVTRRSWRWLAVSQTCLCVIPWPSVRLPASWNASGDLVILMCVWIHASEKPPEWTSSEVDSKRDQNQYFLYNVKSIAFAPFIAEENSSSYQT